MPTYDYTCSHCGHKTEALQKITEEPLKTCPECGKDTLKRGPGGGVGIVLTGDGFYKTMYGSGTSGPSSKSSGSSAGGCCPCGKGKNACTSSGSDS